MRGAIVIVLLAGCAGRSPVEDELRAAIDDLRELESYRYEFRVHTEIPDSDPFDAKGIGVVSGDVLSTEVKATGQLHRIIVASGKRAVIWHSNLEAWVDSVQYGEPDAGRGVQSPSTFLSAIEAELESAAVEVKDLEYVVTFGTAGIQRVTGRLGLAIEGAKWGESSMVARVKVDEGLTIRSFVFECTFKIEGEIASLKTKADLVIVGYNLGKVISDPTVYGRKISIADALKELGLDPAKYK